MDNMNIKKEPLILFLSVLGLYILIIILFLQIEITSFLSFLIRLCALLGLTSMAISTIMTPFMLQLYKIFGKPFIKIHHVTSITAIVLSSIHPISFAIQVSNIGIFIPVFYPWYDFWLLAGRPALILIYIALVSVLLKKKIPNAWRSLHGLNYVALLFGYVHGILIGTDFQTISILIIFTILIILSFGALVYKRIQSQKRKKKFKKVEK